MCKNINIFHTNKWDGKLIWTTSGIYCEHLDINRYNWDLPKRKKLVFKFNYKQYKYTCVLCK